MNNETEWCPTMNGRTFGYKPEYKEKKDKEWQRVPTNSIPMSARESSFCIPYPMLDGGIFSTLGLMGYEQAQAIAWAYAATAANRGVKIDTRVKEYEVQFDLKARPIERERENVEKDE